MIKNLLTKIWNGYSHDPGRALIHTGALGWILCSDAQVTVIATDKKINKKEKRFLLPQEIFDGLTNVFLYYTISAGIKKSGDRLIAKGKLMTDEMADVIMKLKPESTTIKVAVDGLTESLLHKKKITPKEAKKPIWAIINNYKNTEIYNTKWDNAKRTIFDTKMYNAKINLNSFKSGLSVVTAVIASVIASNIITPIVRNKIASVYQQKKRLDNINENSKISIDRPISPAFSVFKSSGNMKI